MQPSLIVTTGNSVEGASVAEYLGIVRGIAVRVPTINQGLKALGNVLSGDLQAGASMYAEVCETTRAQAYQRLVKHARELGADAILAMRYDTIALGESYSEVLAYGTAVKLKVPEALPANA
jgi:uncharacterized protein YbjQ (UPF0145 family)